MFYVRLLHILMFDWRYDGKYKRYAYHLPNRGIVDQVEMTYFNKVQDVLHVSKLHLLNLMKFPF